MRFVPGRPAFLQNPLLRYACTYVFVFAGTIWSSYIFFRYRVAGNALFAIMPLVGIVTTYLWLVLVLDEWLYLLKGRESLRALIGGVKRISFGIIALYGFMALALWVNSAGHEPVIRRAAAVTSISDFDMGAMRYRSVELKTEETSGRAVHVLLTDRDRDDLYVGEDVEILIQRGMLSLQRVLEINDDNEKYSVKMLAAAPDSKVALANLIEIYSGRGEFEKATVYFERLYEKYPDAWEMGVTLGSQLVDAKKFRQGADIFRKVVGARREYEALYGLGYALAWSGQKNEAAVYLKEATELDPTDFRAFYSLGYVYRDTGRYAEAKREWSKVLELVPHFPEVQNNLRSIESRVKR